MKRVLLAVALTTTYAWTTAVAQAETAASTLCRPAAASPAAGAVLPQQRLPDGKFESAWTFSWTPCPGADRYHLFVIGPGDQNPIVNADDLDQTSYTARSTHFGIERLEGWTWRVRAGFGSRWGEWSETRAFNVNSTADQCRRACARSPGVFATTGPPIRLASSCCKHRGTFNFAARAGYCVRAAGRGCNADSCRAAHRRCLADARYQSRRIRGRSRREMAQGTSFLLSAQGHPSAPFSRGRSWAGVWCTATCGVAFTRKGQRARRSISIEPIWRD